MEGEIKQTMTSQSNPQDELEKAFNQFDINGDKKISATELVDAMKALGSDASIEEVKRMIDEIDADGDGFINLDEFTKFCNGRSELEELREAFNLYDQNKNGLISASELQQILSKIGMDCTLKDCSAMIKSADHADSDGDCSVTIKSDDSTDGDGSVSFEEFKKMMTEAAAIPPADN